MKQISKKKTLHSPTLKTIRMVENTIKTAPNSVVKISEIKKLLPRKVNHNTLIEILEYLEQSNKIYIGVKGICWVESNPKLEKAIAQGTKH